jgi:O-methyltransferase involved in polyketide biosynthesis
MIADGLFYYFEDAQVRQSFSMLADTVPGEESCLMPNQNHVKLLVLVHSERWMIRVRRNNWIG